MVNHTVLKYELKISLLGLTKTPTLISGRILTLFIFLLFLLIYQFYSASIVSHLLMKDTTTIKTIHDILTSSLEVGCEDILYNRDYFTVRRFVRLLKYWTRKVGGRINHSNNQQYVICHML